LGLGANLTPDTLRVLPLPSVLAHRRIALFLGVDEFLPRIAVLAAGPPVSPAFFFRRT